MSLLSLYNYIHFHSEIYRDSQGLAQVILLSRSFMSSTAKAKTAKLSTCSLSKTSSFFIIIFDLVRTLLDYFIPIPNSTETQMKVLLENIDWAKKEKRIFLKHSLETRLVGMCVYISSLFLFDVSELNKIFDADK